MTLTPAYRDYKTAKEVKTAFNEDKDFIIADMFHKDSGRICNKSDLKGERSVNIRYARLTKITVIKL